MIRTYKLGPAVFVDMPHVSSVVSTSSKAELRGGGAAFARDLNKFLSSDDSARDVVITCQQSEFRASKLVLSARSAVFAAMLSADMEEAKGGRINIADAEPAAVDLFLK